MPARPKPQHEVDHEQQHAGREHEGADGGDQVERVPAHGGRIGPHAARHAHQTGDVHREERDVEAEEHQPEHPAPERLGQHGAAHHRGPVVERREQRKDHPADQHVVEMRDHEVGVVHLEIERHHGDHHAGESAEREDEQEAEDEQRRRRDAQALAAAPRWWRSRRTPGCRRGSPPPCWRRRRTRGSRPECRW